MSQQKNEEWNENSESRSFKYLMQRMSTQFVSDQNCTQYQPGFVPSSNWSSPEEHRVENPNSYGQNTFQNSVNPTNIGVQNSLKNVYVSQDYSLLNNSNNFFESSECAAQEAPAPYSTNHDYINCNLENFAENRIKPQTYFSESTPVSNYVIPTTKVNERFSNESMQYEIYKPIVEPDIYTRDESLENSFSSKFSNFTASLGTWLSPLDQLRCNNQLNSCEENYLNDFTGVSSMNNSSNYAYEPDQRFSPRPSYSDVVSKMPLQETKSYPNYNGQKFRNSYNKSRDSNKSGSRYKNRNNQISGSSVRSSSPSYDFNSSEKTLLQRADSFASVGLDNFEMPDYSNQTVSSSKILDSSEKRNSLTSEDSSPAHLNKKSKNDVKKVEKLDEQDVTEIFDSLKQSNKLNNCSANLNQKQTPKKTAYINNNFASNKIINNDFSNQKKFYKEETKTRFNEYSNCKNISMGNQQNVTLPSKSNAKLMKNYGKFDGKIASRKSFRKQQDSDSNFHYEFFMAGWKYVSVWLKLMMHAVLWVVALVSDVIQMSSKLFLELAVKMYAGGKTYLIVGRELGIDYWQKFVNYLKNFKFSSSKSKSEKKISGLESNLPMPTTGEEAMRRLLAGREKDAYSILGLSHDCAEDDIKKYYRRQAFLVHPDKNKQPGAEEAFKILAHAYEIIGTPERRSQYDIKLAEDASLESVSAEMADLLKLLKEKLEEAANTIRCTNCNKRHGRIKMERPVYAARHCGECKIRHAAREGDIWAESRLLGLRWRYFACMEGAIYDISEWASCQKENLKHLQANTHSVQYRIVSGKKNNGVKNPPPECPPTEPEVEEFFNNLLYRQSFGQDMVNRNQCSNPPVSNESARKRKGKKKK